MNRNTSAWECMFKCVFPLSSSRKWASVILVVKARNLCFPPEASERVPRASMSVNAPAAQLACAVCLFSDGSAMLNAGCLTFCILEREKELFL